MNTASKTVASTLIGFASLVAAANEAPRATLDLTTADGIAATRAEWRYGDVAIVPARFRAPDLAGQPYGAEIDTFDITPQAGAVDFDDSAWETLTPATVSRRLGNGRLSFAWYRLRFTVPEHIGTVATRDAQLIFSTVVDDYAEVWVDGELARATGQAGGSVVAGWNAENRVVVTRRAIPGQAVQVAIFGINGPISARPTNYVWLHSARLEVHAGQHVPIAIAPAEVNLEVERLAPELDRVLSRNPKLYKLAEGFQFTEGPAWQGDGVLLFSDPNANRIYRYAEGGTHGGQLSVWREHSGYAGADAAEYHQPGSNGLAFDASGRLVINQHGNRRVVRIEADGRETTLAERFDGKRLNSPNDLVYKADGSLYFTDPPFGLPRQADDPRRELDVFGVYRVKDGVVELLASDLKGPNGIAFAPDERTLYVGNWDPARKVVMRYTVTDDGRLGQGAVLIDMTGAPGEDAIDGIKVDRAGHLFISGPGGLWIVAADGRHLGTVRTPRHVHNLAWGGNDGRTLYLTARDRLYRMDVLIPGAGR